jgi:hypothetical protein
MRNQANPIDGRLLKALWRPDMRDQSRFRRLPFNQGFPRAVYILTGQRFISKIQTEVAMVSQTIVAPVGRSSKLDVALDRSFIDGDARAVPN